MPSGGAEGAAQSDLGAAFEDGDDHDVGDADRADEQGDGAEAEEQAVEGALASAWATSAADGWLTLTWLGFSGLAVAARRLSTALPGCSGCEGRSWRVPVEAAGTSPRRGSRPVPTSRCQGPAPLVGGCRPRRTTGRRPDPLARGICGRSRAAERPRRRVPQRVRWAVAALR